MKAQSNKVFKHVLKNGLTVLVRHAHNIPKVSTQIWYNVGSKDEKSGQKGIAHFLEHMIFKGTKEMSESDINLITHKLSGYCNAFTSYDYTGYLFDFPSHHWQDALPIMADCMKNCTFKQDMLNSELKAVIQELKMYKDDYDSSLVENLISTVFTGHPYQNPIIGYKHDLWNLKRENIIDFYKQHYVPNNATLVVVGDVNKQEVFDLAEKYFGEIPKDENYKKEEYNIVKDLVGKTVTLYRDVAQPSVVLAFTLPEAKAKQDYVIEVLSRILAQGRSSRLYKKLINELELAIDIQSFNYDLFDQGIFFIQFVPKEQDKINEIIAIIKNEIENLRKDGPTQEEINKAVKKTETSYLSLLENNQKQAYVIGKTFLATGDENYIFNYLEGNNAELKSNISTILKNNFSSALMNMAQVLPINEDDKEVWLELQKLSDIEDAKVLSGKSRTSSVEPGSKVSNVNVKESNNFNFPKYDSLKLDNGIEVLFYNNENLPKIDLILELKAKHYYDNEEKQGLSNFVNEMLFEGTNKYTADQLAHKLESLGIKLSISSGYITMSMLSSDFENALELLTEILTDSVFSTSSIEKVRKQIFSDIKEYWDDASNIVNHIAKEQIYENHHYNKNALGTAESISSITRDDLIDYYKKFISPVDSILAIVGDLKNYDVKDVLKKTVGKWQGTPVHDLEFKQLEHKQPKEINYYINRDQVVLGYAGLSIDRKDPNYDKFLIFDQIFCGGVLGSMSSRLFQLREQSGLFYTIGGSLLSKSDHQPGMTFIKTIVSIDRLAEAEKLIEDSINKATENITDEEFAQAKNALASSLVENFGSNKQIASSFIFLRKYNFEQDFFDKRANQLEKITIEDIKISVSKILNTGKMIKLRAGRVK